MNLPDKFRVRIKNDLKSEYEDFIKTYNEEPLHGIRINTKKITRDEFLRICPFELETIPWDDNGFIYDAEKCKPSKHPLYHAGLYYIQEPSAMAPANILKPKPGNVVLDLCAAPGGKSVQLSAMMKDSGLLVCNDINPKRVRALIRNMEWFGIRNVIILNEDPIKIAGRWKSAFDCILVDAPCSGEGMFRRDSKAVESWGKYEGDMCTDVQREIICAAGRMLKKDGKMAYSTCTFGRIENEEIVSEFVNKSDEFEMGTIPATWNISDELTCDGNADASGFGRIWPHRHRGEGHFMASIYCRKNDEPKMTTRENGKVPCGKSSMEAVMSFVEENITGFEESIERIVFFENKVYVRPEKSLNLSGLKYVRNGWYIGEVNNGRFIPSQSLAMGLEKRQVLNTIDLDMENPDVLKYLKGETLGTKCCKGWHLVCVEGYPLGWGKGQGGSLKNMYNKHWRMQG
ncbi:MAG: RsmB/NOP family class I SAM-dependent RNA methyltransferase [Peptostreptococcaceae bacterium]|nr:RsmB/NOP family class I SAM-dependent RNA methyltransferase [Peptostreptococcaceae bacterium]